MAILDYDLAKTDLRRLFEDAEECFQNGQDLPASEELRKAAETLFSSNTQSYREVLVGCALARLQNNLIDIRKPYINQGDDAFNGRTLDEQVVNPFMQDRRVPSSKGPYLAVFRRNVALTPETGAGLRDKAGYEAMLTFIDALERTSTSDEVSDLTRQLLFNFVKLRNSATVPLSQIARLSVTQIQRMVDEFGAVGSGGLIPVLLTVALIEAVRETLKPSWDVEFQGINVADRATGAGGDITVSEQGRALLAVEVTERPIDRRRVVSTFNTKIVESGIRDYLFVYTVQAPQEDALEAASAYFAQGHEINFLQLTEWTSAILSTLGLEGRENYLRILLEKLESAPAKVKVGWNDVIRNLMSG